MQQTFCDECGNEMMDKSSAGIIIEEYSIFGPDVSDRLLGDYCDNCTEVIEEAVKEAFSDE